MKHLSLQKSGCGIAVAAFAAFATALAPLSTAQAASDVSNPELGIYGHNISEPGGGTPAIDTRRYDAVNLGPLSASLWTPKRGAQGPLRDDTLDQAAMADRASHDALEHDMRVRLGPIGGRDTP